MQNQTNPYSFERDNLQWMLVKAGTTGERSKTPGKDTKTIVGFYPKLEQAALRMQEALIRDGVGEEPTLIDIRDEIAKSNAKVIAAIQELHRK